MHWVHWGDFALLHLKLHRLRRLRLRLRVRLQCTTRVQLPVSVSVYGNRGPLCLSLTAFALRLLGRNAPTTFSRRSHRMPATPASTSLTSASSSLLLCCHRIDSPRVVAVILLYGVQRAHPGSERARVLSLAQQRRARERVTRCSLALTGALWLLCLCHCRWLCLCSAPSLLCLCSFVFVFVSIFI